MFRYLIEVSNDFVQQPETLEAFFVNIRLCVKLFKIRYGGEHHTDQVVGLMIQILTHTHTRKNCELISSY